MLTIFQVILIGLVIATAHDPNDARTLNEVTTRFDARNRAIASTVWLSPRGHVDPNNVPIAGGGAAGDPAASEGLTTRMFYDEDLTDGTGLVNKICLSFKLQHTGSAPGASCWPR